MAGHVVAPVGVVLQLQASATSQDITGTLREWLQKVHDVELQSGEYEGLLVDWRSTVEDPFTCQLVCSDSKDRARRTITVVCDNMGNVAFVEETPFAAADAPHPSTDLSEAMRLLLRLMVPMTSTFQDLARGAVNDLQATDATGLISHLGEELAPGLLIAVITPGAAPTSPQAELLDDLAGLAIVGTLPSEATLFSEVGLSTQPRSGSIVSLSRSAEGLDAQVIASTSLRTKPDSARRLTIRRQLAAPVPFDLERRRSGAMTRLLTGGPDIDLPTALQLLEEESQRANDLVNRVKELELLLELAYGEQDSALGELDDAQSQVRYLQKAFKELGEVPIVETEDDDNWLPDCSGDAVVAARESLPYLIIGATDAPCDVLDAHQKRGIWAKKIWSSLRALNDYCRAKAEGRFSGDIAMYRDNTPDGAIPLLAEYAASESKTTGDDSDLTAIRTFAIPTSVDPSGKTYMQQHVKIDKGGQSAPRIHLSDHSGGPTQRIYIGYIGPHLPTAGGF